ncbi:phosphate acyltransferase PlsX [Paraliomyxa miuraensis]|uniref:phosphate acyltransferase PlsX n=1 Tax=Paraliomyxa miuraensis TaxID=376150 RepID=UPI00225BA4A8|nr:phosphate acyltransferase PlsX [Paraliomyxa miuraensis]MCX4244662.1 phosphate acyltransferase PlsX [Paraliomyxa miuraensis]
MSGTTDESTIAATIALDAFGGDECPGPEVDGAVRAARTGARVILVGDRDKLELELSRHPGWDALPLSIHHASEVITMEDSPAKAVRSRPDASMPVCFDLVGQGKAHAVMSAGNSGAMLACGLFKFRRIKGVDRPALVTSLPTLAHGAGSSGSEDSGTSWVDLLDIGANVDCRPVNLVQFAIMGAVHASFKHGKAEPRVGVLSNGTEDGKGTELTRTVHRLLGTASLQGLRYVGYVEGHDLMTGEVDVVVTDGFTGNVALKIAEATGRLIGHWIRGAVRGGPRRLLGAALLRPAFDELRDKLDPDTYGSAPLLGVDGSAFICHGGASGFAIGNAIRLAERSVAEALTPRITEALARHAPLMAAARGDGTPPKESVA